MKLTGGVGDGERNVEAVDLRTSERSLDQRCCTQEV